MVKADGAPPLEVVEAVSMPLLVELDVLVLRLRERRESAIEDG